MQRQRQQTTTRGLSPSGRTLQEDGLDEDVVGHKAAAGRANAARSPPGSCQLIAVPRQLLPATVSQTSTTKTAHTRRSARPARAPRPPDERVGQLEYELHG